jgi:hypothetical protein
MNLIKTTGLLLLTILAACSPGKKETVLVYSTQFDSEESVFWTGDDGSQMASQMNGFYYFKSLDKETRFNAPKFEVEGDDNYTIEVAMGAANINDSLYYGITLGQTKEKGSFIDFMVNKNGEYRIICDKPIKSGKFGKKPSDELVKFEIRKKGLTTEFYIDEVKIYSYDFPPMGKFRTGPLTQSGGHISMDYIKITKED